MEEGWKEGGTEGRKDRSKDGRDGGRTKGRTDATKEGRMGETASRREFTDSAR